MRIAFTGGSGKAGRHVTAHLADLGHKVVNLDLVAAGVPGVHDLTVDLTDNGQVYSALSGRAGFDELDTDTVPKFDALVHFAAVARILLTSDNECFRVNSISTYNVMEAAVNLGIPKIIFASSETTYGICFAQGEVKPAFVPVDETHPTIPHDSYAMSKICNEACGRSFQARSGIDIYGLRINNVIEPHEYETIFPAFLENPDLRRRNIFGYIDARDLAQMVERCLNTGGLGFEIFNVANADTSVNLTADEIMERYYSGIPMKRDMGRHETFYSIDKARRLLGFEPKHGWRETIDG